MIIVGANTNYKNETNHCHYFIQQLNCVRKAYAMNITLPKYILVVLNEWEKKSANGDLLGKKNKLSGLKVEEVKW